MAYRSIRVTVLCVCAIRRAVAAAAPGSAGRASGRRAERAVRPGGVRVPDSARRRPEAERSRAPALRLRTFHLSSQLTACYSTVHRTDTVLLKVRALCVPNTYVLVHYTGTAGGVQGAAARALRRRVPDDLHREGAEVPARRAGHADTQAVRASLFCQRLILMFTRQSLLFCFSHAADL